MTMDHDDVRLMRTEVTADGVFGEMFIPGYSPLRLFTVEDDWRLNLVGVSCIPAGSYLLHRTVYYKHHYETFEITGVPHRSRCLIHPANTEEDVKGCVGVGLRLGRITVPFDEDTGALRPTKQAVVDSQAAFHQFMDAMSGYDARRIVVSWSPAIKNPEAV
jgi:hypothetical protein